MKYGDYIIYLTIIGARGMQGRPWNGHSMETYMEIPDGLTDEEMDNYIKNSMIVEWRRRDG
jgi:hypothetical protein